MAISLALLLNLLLVDTVLAQGYPGLATRSQNPLLQSYFVPVMPVSSDNTLSFSHSLYFTNTYQIDSSGAEQLLIDVENTRYDFQLTYRNSLWLFNLTIPLIANRSGFLDQTIERWHDFFGLPQGGRDSAVNNQINLLYQVDGNDIINSREPSEGIGDIQLAAGYQLDQYSQIWFALEMPSADNSLFISNQEAEYALWYSTAHPYDNRFSVYTSLGLAFPANAGLFRGRTEDRIVFGQLGTIYSWFSRYQLLLQLDYHSAIVSNSNLDALDDSIQAQFGLRITGLGDQQLDIFFSEDIFPGHAPDITFGIRLSPYSF